MKIYLEHFFQKNIPSKELYKEYIKIDSFDDATLILENPDKEELKELLLNQRKVSKEMNIGRPSNLLVKLIIDLEKESFWFWNGEFSDSESAYIDIYEEKASKVNSAGDVVSEGFLFLQGFWDDETDKIITSNMLIRNSFVSRVANMSVDDMESLLAVFDTLMDYIDNPKMFASRILDIWLYDKRLEDYLSESEVPELLQSMVNLYAPEFKNELIEIGF